MKHITSTLLLATLLIMGPRADVVAQEAFKITIEDGKLFINGKPIPESELPQSLNISSLSGTLNIWSDGNELIEIGNLPFRIVNDRLVPADTSRIRTGRVTVFFADEEGHTPVRVFRADNRAEMGLGSQEFEVLVEKLRFQAREMDSMRVRLQVGPRGERDLVARQLVAEAASAAFMARALPDAQLAEYMFQIESTDRNLYEGLRREHQLELLSHRLAGDIRRGATDEDREALMKQLEDTLLQIFELKQDNRRREIEQLDVRLESLRTTLSKRERQQDLLIKQRLEQLLSESSQLMRRQ